MRFEVELCEASIKSSSAYLESARVVEGLSAKALIQIAQVEAQLAQTYALLAVAEAIKGLNGGGS